MIVRGINLKQALQGAGYKQEVAAKLLGISRPTLSVWCNKEFLSDDVIEKVKTKLFLDLTNVRFTEDGNHDAKQRVTQETNHPPTEIELIYNQLSQFKDDFLEKEKIYRELIAEKDKRLAEKDDLIKVLKEQLAAKSQEGNPSTVNRPTQM